MVGRRSDAIRTDHFGKLELRPLVRGDNERRSEAGDPVIVQGCCGGRSLLVFRPADDTTKLLAFFIVLNLLVSVVYSRIFRF